MDELPSDNKESKLFPFMIFEVLNASNNKEEIFILIFNYIDLTLEIKKKEKVLEHIHFSFLEGVVNSNQEETFILTYSQNQKSK